MKKFVLLILLILSFAASWGQESMHRRVENLISQMTLDEKISLMEHANPAIDRLGLPAYSWWNEALHGVARNGKAQVYPMPIALAATFDPALVERIFESVALEAEYKHMKSLSDSNYRGDNSGLTFFAPNINLFRDPRWGRGMETYGEDPYLTALMGLACVRGLQGAPRVDTLTNVNYHLPLVGACVKHFAVHSGPEGIRHEVDVKASQRDMWTTYLPAFEYIVRRGRPMQVMGGYNRLNGTPLCTNEWLMRDVLRGKWHYDGIIVTDCWALNDCWERDTVIPRHKTHATAALAARDAFGMEVDLECGSGLPALRTAIDSGYVSEEQVDEHLRRILPVRLQIMDFEKAARSMEPSKPVKNNLPREAATESMVMLKNNGVLPLKNNSLAIIGPNINDSAMALGNYNGEPESMLTIQGAFEYLTSISQNYLSSQESMIQNAVSSKRMRRMMMRDAQRATDNMSYYFERGCNLADDNYKLPSDFWKRIDNSEAVVFVGGLSPELEGEELQVNMNGFYKGDRTAIELPEVQRKLIHDIKSKTDKPIVLVLCTGSAIALDKVLEDVDAVVVAWYGGQEMGYSLACSLTGHFDFTGRLPVTFYRSTKQLPDFDDYSMEGRTYRYTDCREAMGRDKSQPLFPFGYGLSYNKYDYDFAFDAQHLRLTSRVSLVEENISQPAFATLQVYLTNLDDPQGPRKQLVGIVRTEVPHTGEASVETLIDPFWMRVFDPQANEMVAPKQGTHYRLHVGWSSADNDLKTIDFVY